MTQWNYEDIKNRYRRYVRDDRIYDINVKLAGIISYEARGSVFEFGCNTGINLHLINLLNKSIQCHGCDLSNDAIKKGNELYGFDLDMGDENYLKTLDEDQFEASFTCSVLCHIPDVRDIIDDLIRISYGFVILCECDRMTGTEWWNHDYESFGFRKMGSILSPDKRNYNFWVFTKEH